MKITTDSNCMQFTVGKWEFEFYTDGYPVWSKIRYEGKEIRGVHHEDLSDLEYGVSKTIERIKNDALDKTNHPG